ncbi:MAG: dihydropteroate synthase [Hyphomicrobium sp.]|nr:dihydropteroate synthase [Hyphomicrobium sp.]
MATDLARLDRERSMAPEHLCGRDDLGFTHLELIDRQAQDAHRYRLFDSFPNQDWYHPPFDGEEMWETFENLTHARPDYAGLAMDRTRIMGIVNVTPDSFSDGGSFDSVTAAIDHALRLADEGADILDIGGESTRPGSDTVPLEEELRRVMPVLEGLRPRTKARISVDTRKAEVMRRAAAAGADILNDVSALTHDPAALETAAATGLPIMLMHAQGDPKTMNVDPQYADVVLDVFDFLAERIAAAVAAGIPKSHIVADPGIGFGKHLHHNVAVLSGMALYHGLGVPILLGASRKKLIGQICNVDDPKARVPGSLAAALSSVVQGVQIVRVHDVAATRQAVAVFDAAMKGREPPRA